MAKNKNGQTVKNKKYYKNKNTSNSKKKNTSRPKNKTKKINNNVSIIVDDKKENLNYNIIEEKNDVPEVDNDFDYRVKRVKPDRKIKTDFNEKEVVVKKEKFLFSDDLSILPKRKKKKKTTSKKEDKVVDDKKIEVKKDTKKDKKEEPISIKVEDNSDKTIEIPVAVKEVVEEKEIVDKAFEESEVDTGDIDKPAIFKNISVGESFGSFTLKLVILLVILILSIFFVINFSIKYMNSTTTKDVGYFESSEVDYTLCSNGKCNSNDNIDSNIDTVNINYTYGLNFDEKINFDGKYNVVAKFEIFDEKNGDVLYSDDKNISKDTFNKKNIQDFEIKEDAVVLLDEYKKYLEKYNKDRDTSYLGMVKVNLYVDGVNGKKRVAALDIPLKEGEQLRKTIISYQAGDASIEDDGTHYGKVYVYLIIISLILVLASSIGVVLLLSGADDEEE